MKRTTLLFVGLVAGIIVIGYSFLDENLESSNKQQPIEVEAVQTEGKQILSNDEDNNAGYNQHAQTIVVRDENGMVRAAPPPPMRANTSRDNQNNTHQAHGHEEEVDAQEKNAPPPPAGAN
jgi:hypothetical protein